MAEKIENDALVLPDVGAEPTLSHLNISIDVNHKDSSGQSNKSMKKNPNTKMESEELLQSKEASNEGDNITPIYLPNSEKIILEIDLSKNVIRNDLLTSNINMKYSDKAYEPSTSSELEKHVIDIDQVGTNKIIENSPTKIFDSVSLSEPCCRVCQFNEEGEKLISPCHCSGSVKWIHESCLVKWMKSASKDSCELCRKPIMITKRRKPFGKWKLPSQRPTSMLWVLVFVTAIALNLASVIKDASRLCSSTPCLVFYVIACVGVVLGTLFLVYWVNRAKIYIHQWIELNEEWVVIMEDVNKQVKNYIPANVKQDKLEVDREMTV